MQTAFHTDSALAALKQAVADANTQTLLGFERLNAAVQLAAAHTNEVTMNEAGATRALIGTIDRENLNRQLSRLISNSPAKLCSLLAIFVLVSNKPNN